MPWSSGYVSLVAVPLCCLLTSSATGQSHTGHAFNEPSGETATFQRKAIGFGETTRTSGTRRAAFPVAHVEGPPDLRPMLEKMWRHSPTFRRQCARLVDASLTVVVRLVGPAWERPIGAAVSRISLENGLVTSADVRLVIVEPEYLAHEIEHVIEQLDGIDLRSAAAQGLHGVSTTDRQRFETARAISVEGQVARELGR